MQQGWSRSDENGPDAKASFGDDAGRFSSQKAFNILKYVK
jgi:hypothetical protein